MSQRLSTVREFEVVPTMIKSRGSQRQTDVTELSSATGAGIVVHGSYALSGGQLAFQVGIVDALKDKMLPGPSPVWAPRDDPMQAVEELGHSVAACLAPLLATRSTHISETLRPPSLEAYRGYIEGLESFIRRDWDDALRHFEAAVDVEPDYALPRIVSAIVYWNMGLPREARGVVTEAQASKSAIGPFEAAVLSMVSAWLVGDWRRAYEAARVQAEMAPESIPHFQVAEEARRLNRPREALNTLRSLTPETDELRGWIFYWIELATVHHLLGEHEAEHAVIRQARASYPGHPIVTLLEVRTLAALGELDAVSDLVELGMSSPGWGPPDAGEVVDTAVEELAAHGHTAAASALAGRSVSWHTDHLALAPDDEARRRRLARSRYRAGDLDGAYGLFHDLLSDGWRGVRPMGFHHGHLGGHLDAGYLAAIAVQRGDIEEIERWSKTLATLDEPFLYGANQYWLSVISALNEDRKQAVARLRRSLAEGFPFGLWVHTTQAFADLRGYEPYETLVRARG